MTAEHFRGLALGRRDFPSSLPYLGLKLTWFPEHTPPGALNCCHCARRIRRAKYQAQENTGFPASLAGSRAQPPSTPPHSPRPQPACLVCDWWLHRYLPAPGRCRGPGGPRGSPRCIRPFPGSGSALPLSTGHLRPLSSHTANWLHDAPPPATDPSTTRPPSSEATGSAPPSSVRQAVLSGPGVTPDLCLRFHYQKY